jgi:hypothetical protein
MSLASSRLSLIHRCTIERDASAGTAGAWNTPAPPLWVTHIDEQPCRAWVAADRPVVRHGTLEATLVELAMIVPLGTDVTAHDRVAAVSNRGELLFEGPLTIHAVLPRRDHLELILSRAV